MSTVSNITPEIFNQETSEKGRLENARLLEAVAQGTLGLSGEIFDGENRTGIIDVRRITQRAQVSRKLQNLRTRFPANTEATNRFTNDTTLADRLDTEFQNPKKSITFLRRIFQSEPASELFNQRQRDKQQAA